MAGQARVRKKSAARLVEDCQLRHERVAGIDVAKAKGDVCTRLPPGEGGARRQSRLEEVPATVPEITALAGRLLADGVELVTMESTLVISSLGEFLSSFCSSGLSRTRLRR